MNLHQLLKLNSEEGEKKKLNLNTIFIQEQNNS